MSLPEYAFGDSLGHRETWIDDFGQPLNYEAFLRIFYCDVNSTTSVSCLHDPMFKFILLKYLIVELKYPWPKTLFEDYEFLFMMNDMPDMSILDNIENLKILHSLGYEFDSTITIQAAQYTSDDRLKFLVEDAGVPIHENALQEAEKCGSHKCVKYLYNITNNLTNVVPSDDFLLHITCHS